MSLITLAEANTIIKGAIAEATKRALKPLGIVILDPGGHLVACSRQDGASIGRIQLATGKAAGALFLGVSSRTVQEIAADRPAFVASLGPITSSGVVPAAGGVIIGGADGQPLGAVGISGDTSDNDELCALAGIAAAALRTSA